MAKKPTIKRGEVFAMPHLRGTWGACQVLHVDLKSTAVLVLDHLSDGRPTLDAVSSRSLVRSGPTGVGEVALYGTVGDLPPDFASLGVRDPTPFDDLRPRVFAAWEALRGAVHEEQRWLRLPASAREVYRRAAASDERVAIGFPSGPLTMPRSAAAVRLVFGDVRADRTWHRAGDAGAFDWSVLDGLPCLSSVAVCGDVAGLDAWLATRPVVSDLLWESFTADAVDLRGANLTRCELRPVSLATLALPPALDALTLALSAARATRVEATDDGATLSLRAELWARDDLGALDGLRAAPSLTVAGFGALDVTLLAAFERLRSLTLEGAPGRLQRSDALARLGALRTLRLTSCVDADVAHMPALSAFPALSEVRAWGLHQRDVAALMARWGNDRRVTMTAPVDDVMAFATADHPLCRWPGGQRKGIVCSGYAAAATQIMTGELTEAVGVKALRAFVTGIQRAVAHTGALTAEERADVEVAWARLTARARERAPTASFAAVRTAW